MTDEQNPICATCGKPLPSNAPDQLCTTCLLSAALGDPSTDEFPVTAPSERFVDLDSTDAHLPKMGETHSRWMSGDSEKASRSPPLVAPREFGGYRLMKMLGQGGMGVVYEAEQIATGRRVALKMLGGRLDSPEMRLRFLREGRLAAGVSHPNSVYVFGTEEIEGLPVITMEIAGGGTLQDQLKTRGRFPVVEAVDAMLDVVDGLEAALAGDVLHRDIKPSNCFVDPNGRVMIGDFGLSVSTVSNVDSFASQPGLALGTPAFSSPEQLRGNELDCRSDIYAIGSTLYTLLIGEPPFQGNNAIQVVTAVLDDTPSRLDALRLEIPSGLAACVAKCLAKNPAARFSDYASLRAALLPFSTRLPPPQPAPLVRRTLAGMIDTTIGWFMPQTVIASTIGIHNIYDLSVGPTFWALTIVSMSFYLFYMGSLEAWRGAAVGKWLLGLRVHDRKGLHVSYSKAFARAAIALASLQGMFVLKLLAETGWLWGDWPGYAWAALFFSGWVAGILFPFITMRKRNQYATLWDIATTSRVIMAAPATLGLRIANEGAMETDQNHTQQIGPYAISRTIIEDHWIEAIDLALGRVVWLRRRLPSGLSNARRDVARPTRPRWLQSVHTEDAIWDAFEATRGTPLPTMLAEQESNDGGGFHWAVVRRWLYDLSLELASAEEDATLPDGLSLDHVWVAESGRAILLDRAMTIADVSPPVIDVSDTAGQQSFLKLVADCATANSIPVHAKDILKNIAAGTVDRLSFLAGNMRSMLTKPAMLDRGGRATAILTLPVFLIGAVGLLDQTNQQTYQIASARWSAAYQNVPPLCDVLRYRDAINEVTESKDAVLVHLAGHYGELKDALNYRADQSALVATLGDRTSRTFLQSIVNDPPDFTSEQLRQADQQLVTALKRVKLEGENDRWGQYLLVAIGLLAMIGVTGFLTTVIFGATLSQFVFGYAVVTDDGVFASRLRLLGRWLITWSPVLLTAFIGDPTSPVMLILVPWLIGVGIAIINPQRGLAERWTGTWLVPR